MQSLTRKMALRASSQVAASALNASKALARTGQVARTTLELGDTDVFLDEALSSAADTSETVGEHEGELEGSRELTDDVVDVLPDMTEDAWEAEDVGQIAADGADWAAEFAAELEVELEAAKVELEQALTEAHDALEKAGLARSEAAQAVADAAIAADAAAQAVQDALAASQLAEGAAPSWNTADPVAADAAGKPVGAIWYVRNTAGNVIRMWELTALGWIARPFDETVIPQVAIGGGTYGSLAGDRLVAKSITAAQIKALAITAAELATNSVTAVKIAANAVTADKILAGAVTTDKLIALAVTAEKIATGAIIADKIAAGAITTAKLAATAIDGMTITGALIRTAATGQRMEFNVHGLRAIASNGAVTASISSASGGMLVSGPLISQGTGVSTVLRPEQIQMSQDGVGTDRQSTVIGPGSISANVDNFNRTVGLHAFGGNPRLTLGHFPEGSSWTNFEIAQRVDKSTRIWSPGRIDVWADEVEGVEFYAPVKFLGDTDWRTFTMSGWTTQMGAPPSVRVKNGVIYFRGVVSHATFDGGFTTVGTLPTGIPAPVGYATATITTNSTFETKMRVTADRLIQIWRNGTSGAWVSLNPMFYTP
ncbi:hypothetical protein ACF07D_07475 [Leucobacter sp. NPDC015123]|uniref:hypothetical protein n=1 Tax=Leucobacter sp. NPDC015123 TaxID=3364129 RepID=UPI0036F48CF0